MKELETANQQDKDLLTTLNNEKNELEEQNNVEKDQLQKSIQKLTTDIENLLNEKQEVEKSE